MVEEFVENYEMIQRMMCLLGKEKEKEKVRSISKRKRKKRERER